MAKRGTRTATTGTEQIDLRLEALRKDLRALQGDVKELGAGVGAAAQEKLAEVLAATENLALQVDAWANENVESVRDAVREKPIKACLIAMGAGVFLGAVVLRR